MSILNELNIDRFTPHVCLSVCLSRRIALVLMALRYLEQSVRNIKFLQNFVT